MTALVGFFGEPDRALLTCMQAALPHRAKGAWHTVETPLASMACASRFPQPLPSRDCSLHHSETLVLAVAGTLPDLAAEEPDLGPRATLADLVAARYRREGLLGLERLRGAFVLALVDGDRRIVMRDGVGQKTLYIGFHQGRWFFAVEPKAIWQLPGFPRRIRPEAVARYFSFSFQPGSETMLADLDEVSPGHILYLRHTACYQQRRWFRFEESTPELFGGSPASSTEFWVQTFQTEFAQAVARRLPERDSVGAFLSGGIDSSVVVAELARQRPGQVRTFAIHFGAKYPNELPFARMVATACKTQHEEVEVAPHQFLPLLRQIIYAMDDPIGDPVTMPNFMLARHVAAQMDDVFNGEGGDPCFGGPKNVPMMLHHWYGGFDQEPNHLERAYLRTFRRAYEELPYLLSPSLLAQIDIPRQLEGILTPYFYTSPSSSLLHRLIAMNIRVKGAHLILPKVERMLAFHGMAPCSPLFDERLVQLSLAMPPKLKLAAGIEKVILKKAYAHLPQPILDRPKSGMRVPVHYWFQNELERYARRILSPKSLAKSGLFQPERVKSWLAYDLEAGHGRYGIRLWMLLTFEIWRRLVIEGEPL